MIRCEIVTDSGGKNAMMVDDDSAGSYALVLTLASAVTVPATVRMIPIPPTETGRLAMFWYPKRTPHKEQVNDHSNPPCLDDAAPD